MTTPTATTSPAVPEAHRLDGLLASSGPPRRAGALTASATFGWRAMLKIKHEPKQLTDVIAIPVLITVLFTYLFGGTISGSPHSYLNILLPGTLVMGIALVTMYGGARLAQDVTTGVLMPLSFASNVFVQPRTMPGWLQAFVNVNPVTHLATAARDLMNNTGGAGGPVAWSLIATAAITLVFAPLTLHLYSKPG